MSERTEERRFLVTDRPPDEVRANYRSETHYVVLISGAVVSDLEAFYMHLCDTAVFGEHAVMFRTEQDGFVIVAILPKEEYSAKGVVARLHIRGSGLESLALAEGKHVILSPSPLAVARISDEVYAYFA